MCHCCYYENGLLVCRNLCYYLATMLKKKIHADIFSKDPYSVTRRSDFVDLASISDSWGEQEAAAHRTLQTQEQRAVLRLMGQLGLRKPTTLCTCTLTKCLYLLKQNISLSGAMMSFYLTKLKVFGNLGVDPSQKWLHIWNHPRNFENAWWEEPPEITVLWTWTSKTFPLPRDSAAQPRLRIVIMLTCYLMITVSRFPQTSWREGLRKVGTPHCACDSLAHT